MTYVILAILWISWCSLHSFMISRTVVLALEKRFGDRFRYYRIFFNLVSIVTLIPVLIYSSSLRSDPFFAWSGAWRPVQFSLALGALALFYAGGRHYDLGQFLGIRQVVEHADWSDLQAETAGKLRVTVSIGLAEARGEMRQTAVLSKADTRLYRAKNAGRNRVIS